MQTIHSLGTNRNANRVLSNMSEYLNNFMDKERIFYLNKKGRQITGARKELSKAHQYAHTLMRNDVYIHFNCPKMWQHEFTIRFDDVKFVADAVFQVGNQQYFLEVDRLQKMNSNFHKLKQYKRFKDTGLWQKKNDGRFPSVLFYTVTDSRRFQLLEKTPEHLAIQVVTRKDLLI